LNPANKATGSQGRELYLQKQRELLASSTSLLELDLLTRGEHTVAVPLFELQRRGEWDYLICLHRAQAGWDFDVWPVGVRQRLPSIQVPLAAGDADVVVDLQTVFDRCYDEGAYARLIDYTQPPGARLRRADMDWVNEVLQDRF
jgi:hypothetical protein